MACVWHPCRQGVRGGLRVERPNQVWCADITYLPMRRGFLYLVAIMDWFTRKVLAWRISNTLEADFCVEALNEAIHRFGPFGFNKPCQRVKSYHYEYESAVSDVNPYCH